MPRAASVARTHSTGTPSATQPSTTSLTRRVLPTPASPTTTAPFGPREDHSRRRRSASSSSRPISGHDTTTTGRCYRERLGPSWEDGATRFLRVVIPTLVLTRLTTLATLATVVSRGHRQPRGDRHAKGTAGRALPGT